MTLKLGLTGEKALVGRTKKTVWEVSEKSKTDLVTSRRTNLTLPYPHLELPFIGHDASVIS